MCVTNKERKKRGRTVFQWGHHHHHYHYYRYMRCSSRGSRGNNFELDELMSRSNWNN